MGKLDRLDKKLNEPVPPGISTFLLGFGCGFLLAILIAPYYLY